MKKLILFFGLMLAGCVDTQGLNFPNIESDTFVERVHPSDALRRSDDTVSICQIKNIGTTQNCRIDIPSPGVTSDMYLFINEYTDGIKGGDAQHYSWYRIVGQDVIILINCQTSYDYKIGITYGCIP